MASLMGDIGSLLGVSNADMVKNSTSRKGNTELNMDDFLQLMIVQLTNQTIDDTMDTSEMMNQMLQMQMITALSNMNDISVQTYANSLVGKKVTIGVLHDNVLEERELFVYGTGTYNGQQVIFCEDGNMYYLSQIMAVGVLPDENGNYTIGGSNGTDGPSDENGDGLEGSGGVDDGLGESGGVGGAEGDGEDESGDDTQIGGAENPDGAEGSGGVTENPNYDGTQGVPSDDQE